MYNKHNVISCRQVFNTVTSVCYLLLIVPIVMSYSFNISVALAEGSKDLIANGGFRAFLEYRDEKLAGIPRQSIIYAYAESGETIEVASSAISAMGIGNGSIQYIAPDNATYTFTSTDNCGAIANLTEEESRSYFPCLIPVNVGQTGIWAFHFISPDLTGGNPSPVDASVDWSPQNPTGDSFVTAWDVTVLNAGTPVLGRVFANFLSLNMGNYGRALNAVTYIKTRDGVLYKMNLNGLQPFAVTFFANNKGFTAGGDPVYRSVQFADGTGGEANFGGIPPGYSVHNPSIADTTTDFTHKIFFNLPDTNMPPIATPPGGGASVWLNPTYTSPQGPADIEFTGMESTPTQAGTSPFTGNFTFFNAGSVSSYAIKIDINNNGTFGDGNDRILIGATVLNTNTVEWDMLDGNNVPVPANDAGYRATIEFHYGEVHFPFFDAEGNPNGFKFERLDPGIAAGDTAVIYYDNRYDPTLTYTLCANGETPVPAEGCYGDQLDVRDALAGVNSSGGANRWANDFGNKRGIDVWGYVITPPVELGSKIIIKQADLQISQTASVQDNLVTFEIVVTNAGPSEVTADVKDTLPAAISSVTWTCAITSGTGTCDTPNGTGNNLNATVTLASSAQATFTVQGQISGGNTLVNTATVVRPLDVNDPDETNNEHTLEFSTVDLAVVQTASSSEVKVDDTVTLTVRVTNQGENNATNVQVKENLPSSFELLSNSVTQGIFTESTGVWEIGNLAVGATATLNIVVRAIDSGIKSATAQLINLDQIDSDSRNNEGSISLNIIAQVRLTIGVLGEGIGTVTSSPDGIECSNNGAAQCETRYEREDNITVTLIATPDAGSAFSYWTGNSDCLDGQVLMDRSLQCYGHFIIAPTPTDTPTDPPVETFTLQITVVGRGQITSEPATIQCNGDSDLQNTQCQHVYEGGESVTLSATPEPTWELQSWGGDCLASTSSANVSTGSANTLEMTAHRECTVTFVPTEDNDNPTDLTLINLTVGIEGDGTVTGSGINCGEDCSEGYLPETHLVLTAQPDPNGHFLNWAGDCQGAEPIVEIEILKTTACRAIFEKLPAQGQTAQFKLSVDKIGDGTVTSQPQGIDCGELCQTTWFENTEVALTAIPATGTHFSGWEGDCQGTQTAVTVKMEKQRHCRATFTEIAESSTETDETETTTPDTTETTTDSTKPSPVEPAIVLPPYYEGDGNCPPKIILNSSCNAQEAVITGLDIGKYGNLSNAILEGKIKNEGWVANVRIQPNAQLSGGIVTGNIVNAGVMVDFEFRGGTITGGTLAGTIINYGRVSDSLFQNVYLAANTHLSGGQLAGDILGDPQAPALLENLVIRSGSYLNNVIIGKNVQIGVGVTFGKNVKFLDETQMPVVETVDEPAIVPSENTETVEIEKETPETTELPTTKPIYLSPNISISGETITGRLIGNATAPAQLEDVLIATGSYIEHAIVKNNVLNEGTLANIELRGQTLSGGTLAGKIAITFGGTVRDVHLAADSHVQGGNLAGRITGEPNAPALLENLRIAAGTYLEYVIIGQGVHLPKDIILGPGVHFLVEPIIEIPTVERPTQGGAVAIGTSTGQTMTSQAQFFTNLSTKQQAYTNGALFSKSEARHLTISTTITIDPNHVGQVGELFIIAKLQLSSTETYYFMRAGEQWVSWDKEIGHLQPAHSFAHLPLETFEFMVFEGDLSDIQGEITVFVGYSSEQGIFSYNGTDPIHFFIDSAPSVCVIYAVNDDGLNDTQFLKIDLSADLAGVMTPLGPLHKGRDIEGLAMHPTNKEVIYGSSSYHAEVGDERLNGYLYTISRQTGELTVIGASGFAEVAGLAVNPVDKSLWGWARNEEKGNEWTGIIQIDPKTGVGTAIKQFDYIQHDMSGLAASPDGKKLYATSKTTLWVYDIEQQTLDIACEQIDRSEVEGIDMQPNGLLILGANRRRTITFLAYDPVSCTVVNERTFVDIDYDDIESLVWPAEECNDQSWMSAQE